MCTAIREFREEGFMLGLKQGFIIGLEQGIMLGIEQEIMQGRKLGIIKVLKILLNQRLGNISEEIIAQLNQSNEEQLQRLTLNLDDVYSEKDILIFIS